MLNFLPRRDVDELLKIRGRIEELRIRVGYPICVRYSTDEGERKRKFLNDVYTEKSIEYAFMNLCDHSVFGKEECIKQGYITSCDGERVGLCGDVVKNEKGVVTIKNITSLCVRFPNDVSGLALPFFEKYCDKPKSVLVISPPSQGKTTFLRDLGRLYSDKLGLNVLFIDERDEFSASGKFYLGKNSDVMKYADKSFGFRVGVRSLNPNVIVCDELMTAEDLSSCSFASHSGVKTLASVHSDSLKNLLKKPIFTDIFKIGVFDCFVNLKYGGEIEVNNDKGEKC